MSEAVTRTSTVSAAPEKILGVVLDVPSYPQWQKEVETAEVLNADGQGRPQLVKMNVSAMGMKGSYTLEYSYPDSQTVSWRLTEGDMITTNDATYRVVDNGDGTSSMTVEMLLGVKWNLPEFMIDQMINKGINDNIKGIKSIAEA